MNDRPPVDPTFERLKAWRDREVLESRLQLGEIKDTYLRAVARSGRRRADEIAAMLPAALRKYAPALEQLVSTPAAPNSAAQRPASSSSTPVLDEPMSGQPSQPSPNEAGSRAAETAGPAPAPSAQPSAPGSAQPAQPGSAHPQPGSAHPQPGSAQPQSGSAQHAGAAPAQQAAPPDPTPRRASPPGPDPATIPDSPAITYTPAAPPDRPDPAVLAKGFAPYQFAAEEFAALAGPSQVSIRSATGTDGVRLLWDRPDGLAPATAYRVVASDEHPPYSPDRADLVDVILVESPDDAVCRTLDTRPFTAAVRHYQVWCNTGPSLEAAKRDQPRLIAEKSVVGQVADVDLREDEGRVIGQWSVWYGIDRVHIYRTPVERARPGQPDPQYRILAGDSNLGGFVDNDAERGRRYLYQFCTEAVVDGVPQLSGAVTHEVTVSAVVDPITDLEVVQHGASADEDRDDDWQFDLLWSPQPAGRVFVYRTENRPLAGAEHGSHHESALPQMNLPDSDRLAHPISPQPDGRVGMRNVPWPRQWDRAYFTPVVVLDGAARVGRTVPAVRVRPVHDPVIVERCDQQILKFGWPPGAATVLAEVLTRSDVTGVVECQKDSYDLLGGVQFPNPLPNRGATVRLTGVSFVGGERRESVPVEVSYPGLMRIRYVVELRRTWALKPDRVLVRLASESEIANCPPLVLVHHPSRLPLHPGDGQQLEMTEDIEEVTRPVLRFRPDGIGTRPSEVGWRASVRGRTGYIRLFADLPPERTALVAILDPPLDSLSLGS